MRISPIKRSAIPMENITLFTLWGMMYQNIETKTIFQFVAITYKAPKVGVSDDEGAEHSVGQDDHDGLNDDHDLGAGLETRP